MPCSKILLSMYLTKLSDSILSKIYPSVIRVYIQLTIFRSKGTGKIKLTDSAVNELQRTYIYRVQKYRDITIFITYIIPEKL